jgi:hypothetical protein
MKVSVVIRKSWDGWVLRKIGLELVSNLKQLGIQAEYVTSPNPESDINHFLHFGFAQAVPRSSTTTMITHVDDAIKAKRLRHILTREVDGGICMSRYHMDELVKYGIPDKKLSYVLPALDKTNVSKTHFTVQCNRYQDGRKNESFLTKLASTVDLSFSEFSFFGTGWDEIARNLELAGAQVSIFPPSEDFASDYIKMKEVLEKADFYLNLGWDEGSLGSLDAFMARTNMILSAQGYHLNIPGNNTKYVSNFSEFLELIRLLAKEHIELQSSADMMTWSQYALNHVAIWQKLLENGVLGMPLNLTYDGITPHFETKELRPILDLSHRKTFRRLKRILMRKLRIG